MKFVFKTLRMAMLPLIGTVVVVGLFLALSSESQNRKQRLDLGLFQKQIPAQQIGVDETTIWNSESNTTASQIRFVSAIISFLATVFLLNVWRTVG